LKPGGLPMASMAWLAVWLIVITAMIALGIRDVRRDRRKSRADHARRASRVARFHIVDDGSTGRAAANAPVDLDPGMSA
jgi:hypothetical protein